MKKVLAVVCLLAIVSVFSFTNGKAYAEIDQLPKIMKTMSYSAPTQLQ
ncbi:hypothetical protein NCCP2222_28030 [Sporosarcina sp. NCCP-2222]|nr:hypothetical protein [Sporosarcina sp. NCCP-2222]GKV56856.1 hypothetical protein NCCP2222_28030 [Sporosarcina sp. NCCP-2222]